MTPQTCIDHAKELYQRYRRGVITYAELQSELWIITQEFAFYSHTDAEWIARQQQWNDSATTQTEHEYWNELFRFVDTSARVLIEVDKLPLNDNVDPTR